MQQGTHGLHITSQCCQLFKYSLAASPLKPAQKGLHDPHVLKTNMTLHYRSRYLDSSLFLLGSCWQVTEVRCGHVSYCAAAVFIVGEDVKEEDSVTSAQSQMEALTHMKKIIWFIALSNTHTRQNII